MAHDGSRRIVSGCRQINEKHVQRCPRIVSPAQVQNSKSGQEWRHWRARLADCVNTIQIIIPGKPAAWQRARSNGKVRFDSPEQARNKLTIGQIGALAMQGRAPFQGPLQVHVAGYWQWPKSISEKKRRTYGSHFFVSRPDGDNLAKLLGDALNGIVWRDDAQIVSLTVIKRYGLTPQTMISVECLTEEPD